VRRRAGRVVGRHDCERLRGPAIKGRANDVGEPRILRRVEAQGVDGRAGHSKRDIDKARNSRERPDGATIERKDDEGGVVVPVAADEGAPREGTRPRHQTAKEPRQETPPLPGHRRQLPSRCRGPAR
jgi:hypothetical protein